MFKPSRMFGTNSNAVAKTTESVAQPARQSMTRQEAQLTRYFVVAWFDPSNQQDYAKDKQGLVWCWSAIEQLWRR